jgi:uncharacterized membrane protein YhfC
MDSLGRKFKVIIVSAILAFLILLGGSWWPRRTLETRRNHIFGIAFVSEVLAIVALAGYWILFFQLVKTPPNVLADTSKYPLLTVVLGTAMSSLVSPVVEEIAFRLSASSVAGLQS